MAQGVDEARKQRELTKHALAADLDRLRAELHWRTRLRRDGPRIIAAGAAVVVVAATVLVLRNRLRRDHHKDHRPATLEEISVELHEIRKALEKQNGSSGSVVQKALLRGVSSAGSAGGTLLAKRMLQRQAAAADGGAEGARAG